MTAAPAQPSLDDLLARIVRDDVRAMGAYHVPDATGMVKLDAMENPYPLPAILRDALGKRLADVALNRYPCLALAFDALRAGGTAPAVLNAANEVAVDAFLQRRIRFTDIAAVVGDTLARASIVPADSLDTVFAADAQARGQAERYIATACAHLPAA